MAAYPLDDELVLCDTASGQVFTLNATGARVWALCDGGRAVRAVARAIAQQFGIAGDRARSDVEELIAELTDVGLLRLQ